MSGKHVGMREGVLLGKELSFFFIRAAAFTIYTRAVQLCAVRG
ncbi:hypothetical protein QSI_0284 [Clostridioides difficile P28]|nr:hypothetical protein QSI_0284 [Clostridioides difficile P28]